MKREFLKNLGIEDKELIDKILDENSADIGRAKGELDTYKTKVGELENQIKSKDGEIATLKTQVGDTTALNDKIKKLETDNSTLKNDLDSKVKNLQKGHAIENGIRDAKGKNVRAIRALLDEDKITFEDGKLNGLSEQLTTLAGAEDSKMLFGDTQSAPSGTRFSNPPANSKSTPSTSNSLVDAISKALNPQK